MELSSDALSRQMSIFDWILEVQLVIAFT